MKDLKPTIQDLLFEDRKKKPDRCSRKGVRSYLLMVCRYPKDVKGAVMVQFEIQFWHLPDEIKENPQRPQPPPPKKLIFRARFEPRICLVSNHTIQTNTIHNLLKKKISVRKHPYIS
jgi:hypothetical protein